MSARRIKFAKTDGQKEIESRLAAGYRNESPGWKQLSADVPPIHAIRAPPPSVGPTFKSGCVAREHQAPVVLDIGLSLVPPPEISAVEDALVVVPIFVVTQGGWRQAVGAGDFVVVRHYRVAANANMSNRHRPESPPEPRPETVEARARPDAAGS